MKLEVSNLCFGYLKDEMVLDDISLSIGDGSSIAIVGPSGSGKTTLLRIIAGILNFGNQRYFRGRVSWDGAKNTAALRRSGQIGYVFQVPNLLPHLTVAQNVVFPFVSAKLSKVQEPKDPNRLLSQVGLANFGKHFPDQLSVGMRARVALARTFATDPSLLLLDEPFSALDVGWRLTLYDQLWSAVEQQRPTMLLVTHDVSEAFLLASRVAVMNRHGKIVRIVESTDAKPAVPDLDSTREFFRRNADLIEATQYEISRDVVAASSDTAS